MLRNTRIRTRLALMAIAPALTALIVAAITFALVPSISVGGSAYHEIVDGKDFQKGTVDPSLYIIDIHLDVQQVALIGSAVGQTANLEADITRREAAYEQAYQQWRNRLTDPEATTQLQASHTYAEQYFGLVRDRVLPAVRANRRAELVSVFQYQLVPTLQKHRIAIQLAADRVGAQVTQHEKDAQARSNQQLLGIIGITLLLMAGSIALGVTVLRSITDRVRRLNEVATVELPQVLSDVQRAAAAGEEIPSLPSATPADAGADELATAASAFNTVVSTAVEMAAEQARLRRATSQMFINLGRRNHKLLSRTLTYITQLESDERDPATLQNLFRLDHLTTRMRRHAESLLVLAGSPPLRTWSRPVPVADVLRAALSEIETYDRVDIKELEPVEVRGASVSDLAHLIAELLENATAFSPPQTRVRVLGRADNDGYTVVVVDEGIGMSPEELAAGNTLIASSDQSGLLDDSRMLGLGVVGRLAARHGFTVNLTASPVGGVVAWVTLPPSALAPRRGADEPVPPARGLPGATSGPPSPLAVPQSSPPPAIPAPANGRPTAPAPAARWTPPPTPSDPIHPDAAAASRAAVTGSFVLPPRAPALPAVNGTGPIHLPPPPDSSPASSPVSGPIAFRKPAARQEGTGLTRRVRGAQLPDTGEPPAGPGADASAAGRPERSAQSVRGALASFTAGRRTASEVTIGNAAELKRADHRPAPPAAAGGRAPADHPVADPVTRPMVSASTVTPPAPGPLLPRRVRGAQMPQTDLPEAVPAPERTAAEVRAALSNFVAGRRAAEHDE